MKKSWFKTLLFIMAFLMMALALTGCGNSGETLYIELEDYYESEAGLEIVLSTDNDAGHPVALGWVGSCEIEVTTDEETYYYEPFMTEIPRGKDALVFCISGGEGDVEKIVITDLRLLNNRGLPGRRIRNAVVYDERADVDCFEKSFSFFSSPVSVMFVVMPIIVLAFFIIIIVVILRNMKNNRQAAQAFRPFSGGMNNNGVDMHDMHHQMHMDAHQNFMQQEAIRQHTDFAQKSVTFTDQGGFIPPPPPPPPPPPFGF